MAGPELAMPCQDEEGRVGDRVLKKRKEEIANFSNFMRSKGAFLFVVICVIVLAFFDEYVYL